MMRFLTYVVFPLFLVAAFGCGSGPESGETESESLDGKAAPYDQFAFQRSYPDRDFDWRGWRKNMAALRSDFNKKLGKHFLGDNNTADWTLVGPGNVAGRVNALAIKPGDENTVLAGFAGGGIFKTTDGGLNWVPVFDDHLELSIGDITYNPLDPNIVYAGTGDPNMPSIVFNGNGLYKSTDGGNTWKYSGLEQQGIISKVVVDPVHPETLYVATMGNPYVRDGHRGIYKSTDGGATWSQSLFVSDQAGASDLVISNLNPQILYASFWDRIRNNQESLIYGPHARVYKSTDGGATWNMLGGGLPTGVMGRTGLAISQQNPDKVYAIFMDSLSTPGGLYKTTDGGQSWSSINVVALEDACGDFGWYFSKIRLDPTNDEDVYFLAILLWRKPPGNNGWQPAANSHADIHDLVFASTGKRYLGSDGGVYRNTPGQMAWFKSNNLPTTQFYRTNYNPHEPDFYFAGAQDNGIRRGNAGVYNGWSSLFSADGFRCMFHPNEPNTFWVETQNGEIHKTIDGGANWAFGEPCLGTSDRCNWDLPYLLSVHNPNRLFAGTYRVYFSDNGGGWGPISNDLTDGVIFGPRFHSISTLDESPVLAEKLVAGTTDGNVWRREPTGNWSNISAGLPDRYVTATICSPTLSTRIFVTHSGFRNNEYQPHIHRSDNNGQTWTDISGNLPNMPVNDIYVLPGHADSVLFAATDAGVYVSRSSGQQWQRLGVSMPFVPVFDLERNPVKKELIAATFARGLWTFPLDSVFTLPPPPPSATVAVTGTIQTETGSGIDLVRVCTQPLIHTEANGGYSIYSDAPGLSAGVHPLRNNDPLNGVSTFDLVLINKHILGIEPLSSPFKMIAADANNSRSITTFDIVALRKLILGIDTVLANTTSWRFIPKDYSFPNPLNPFAEVFPEGKTIALPSQPPAQPQLLDFTGVKVGDVNENAVPAAGAVAEYRSGGAWPLLVRDHFFAAGDGIKVPVEAKWTGLAGAQFTLHYDPEVLELVRVEPLADGLRTDHFALRPGGQSCVTACFEHTGAETGAGTTALFRIHFQAKTSGNLRQSIQLRSLPTPALAFRADGTVFSPQLQWATEESKSPLEVRFSPNPFGENGTVLNWSGKNQAPAQLTVYDAAGKIVFQQNLDSTEWRLPAGKFTQKGVYWYAFRQGAEKRSGKLVFVGN